MNKVDLAEAISEKTGITKKQAEDAIDSMLDIITEKLQQDEEITLTGFGAFSARTRKGRIGVNPRNPSEKIEIPSVTVPKFKAGKNLKEALKNGSTPVLAEPEAPAEEAPAEETPVKEEAPAESEAPTPEVPAEPAETPAESAEEKKPAGGDSFKSVE